MEAAVEAAAVTARREGCESCETVTAAGKGSRSRGRTGRRESMHQCGDGDCRRGIRKRAVGFPAARRVREPITEAFGSFVSYATWLLLAFFFFFSRFAQVFKFSVSIRWCALKLLSAPSEPVSENEFLINGTDYFCVPPLVNFCQLAAFPTTPTPHTAASTAVTAWVCRSPSQNASVTAARWAFRSPAKPSFRRSVAVRALERRWRQTATAMCTAFPIGSSGAIPRHSRSRFRGKRDGRSGMFHPKIGRDCPSLRAKCAAHVSLRECADPAPAGCTLCGVLAGFRGPWLPVRAARRVSSTRL